MHDVGHLGACRQPDGAGVHAAGTGIGTGGDTHLAAGLARAPRPPGCHPPSPTDASGAGFREVQGTGRGVTLWGLLFFARAQVGKQEKIAWRMTGSGPIIRLTAIGPGGRRHRLAWGPEPHGGSNWNRPGQEWGAG